MCGRMVQTSSSERLAARFGAVDTITTGLTPRHNVAPSTAVAAVLTAPERRLGRLLWGFVPSWAKDPDAGPRPINARIEGVVQSRLFGPSLTRQRCIVPVDAWYEWTDEDGARQPWLLAPDHDREGFGPPVALAALWSTWRDRSAGGTDPRALHTVAVLTTEACGPAASVHHRMPVVVPDVLLDDWLDPGHVPSAALLRDLAERAPAVTVTRVSRRVNDVRNEGTDLLDPVED